MILNTADNLIKRVLSISDEIFHTNNKNKIRNILLTNSFPKEIINRLIHKKSTTTELEEREPKTYKAMSYIQGYSERVNRASIVDKGKYILTPKITNTTRQFFSNTKTKIEKLDKANVIYEIKCDGNGEERCNRTYIGTTKNKLRTRLAGHKSDIKNKNMTKTALSAHCAQKKHQPNWESVKILEEEMSTTKRYMLEMLHIINKKESVNFKTDTENCAQIYRKIVESHQKNKEKHKQKVTPDD